MNKFFTLVKGEVLRMKKYNLLAASLFVSAILVGILHFIDIENVTNFVPMLVFMDVTTMVMLLVGVTFIYERDEGTIRTLLVSPISKSEYVLAKIISNIMTSVLSLTIMYVYSKIFKIIEINYFVLLGGVILIAFFHSLIGFLLTYYSKDFTDLLMAIMKLFFVFLLPVILDEFNIITNEIFKKIVYLLPTKASLTLLQATTGGVETWQIWSSLIYLLMGSVILYYLVLKGFDHYALKEGGE